MKLRGRRWIGGLALSVGLSLALSTFAFSAEDRLEKTWFELDGFGRNWYQVMVGSYSDGVLGVWNQGSGVAIGCKANNNDALWCNGSARFDDEVDLPDYAIEGTEIEDGTITTPDLANASVTASKLADNAVNSVKIADNSITEVDIATDGVGAAEIAPDAVGSSEIAAGAVGSSEIAAGAVGSSEIADNTITQADIATDGVGAAEIAADAVGSSEIAADAVGSSEIAANAVGASEIADNSVTQADIATDGVGAAEIAANAVGASEIASGAVEWAELDPTLTTTATWEWSTTSTTPMLNLLNEQTTGWGDCIWLHSDDNTSSGTWVLYACGLYGKMVYLAKGLDDDQYCLYVGGASSTAEGLYVYGSYVATGTKSTVVETSQGKEPMFCIESPDVEFYTSGTARLSGGYARVDFERLFSEAISPEVPVQVTVTPVGSWSGLYVEWESQTGFAVRSGAGNPYAKFNWIAIGRRVGYDERPDITIPDEEQNEAIRQEKMRARAR